MYGSHDATRGDFSFNDPQISTRSSFVFLLRLRPSSSSTALIGCRRPMETIFSVQISTAGFPVTVRKSELELPVIGRWSSVWQQMNSARDRHQLLVAKRPILWRGGFLWTASNSNLKRKTKDSSPAGQWISRPSRKASRTRARTSKNILYLFHARACEPRSR